MKNFLLVGLLAVAVLAGCTDAESQSVYGSLGKKCNVKLYSGGKLVGEWTSTGRVENEPKSDGWHFVDAATGKYVRIGGDVVIVYAD